MNHTILLFDMDGVLLDPEGYYRALRTSIELVGRNLGIVHPEISRKHIDMLEAAGITHVWDLMMVFTILQLLHVWQIDPSVLVPKHIHKNPQQFITEGRINYTKQIERLVLNNLQPSNIANVIIDSLETPLEQRQVDHLTFVLSGNKTILNNPVLLLLQEYILGSQLFSETYGVANQLDTDSLPLRYNQSTLTSSCLEALKRWLEDPQHHAAIFTNRPNIPPDDVFRHFSTPEAEMGAESIGLAQIPIIGAGSLAWVAEQNVRPVHTYLKPHPIHALAALHAAVGTPIAKALKLSTHLIEGTGDSKVWSLFHEAVIHVYEDSAGGAVSARKAHQILAEHGIIAQLHLIGVSNKPIKVQSLVKVTDRVISDVNEEILKLVQ